MSWMNWKVPHEVKYACKIPTARQPLFTAGHVTSSICSFARIQGHWGVSGNFARGDISLMISPADFIVISLFNTCFMFLLEEELVA